MKFTLYQKKQMVNAADISHLTVKIFLVVSLSVLYSCAQSTQPARPTEMTLEQALLLTQAWCKEVRVSFTTAKAAPNGDFRGVFGSAEIVYSAQDKKLGVQGLVIRDASLQVKRPYFFEIFKRAGEREPYTLGEGYFFIDKTPFGEDTPQLTLRKEFANGSITPKQFILEVGWLMRWSTYWRLQRALDVGTKKEEELIKEAPGIEAKYRKISPRPW